MKTLKEYRTKIINTYYEYFISKNHLYVQTIIPLKKVSEFNPPKDLELILWHPDYNGKYIEDLDSCAVRSFNIDDSSLVAVNRKLNDYRYISYNRPKSFIDFLDMEE